MENTFMSIKKMFVC